MLVEGEDTYWGLHPEPARLEVEVHERIAVLEAVVAAYEGQSRLERIKLADYSLLPEVITSVEHQVVLFPVLHKEEMLHLAAENVMIPTGLTRHIIPGRALGINVDLAFLAELADEASKAQRLPGLRGPPGHGRAHPLLRGVGVHHERVSPRQAAARPAGGGLPAGRHRRRMVITFAGVRPCICSS